MLLRFLNMIDFLKNEAFFKGINIYRVKINPVNERDKNLITLL